MKDKLNLVFKPFIIILIGVTIVYTFFHWMLVVELALFSPKTIITNFSLPAVVTALVAWFFLRPKLKALNLKKKSGGHYREIYGFIAWVALTIPLIIAQEYMITATGKLSELTSVKEIGQSTPTKYYTLKKYYFDKHGSSTYTHFEVKGRYNEDFYMHIYVAIPIFENENDASTNEPSAWSGIKYSKRIDNSLGKTEKEVAYQMFLTESYKDFQNKNLTDFFYFDRMSNSNNKDGFIEAIKRSPRYKTNKTILTAVHEPFGARNGKKLEWMLGSAFIGSLIWLLMVTIPKVDKTQLSRVKAVKPHEVAQEDLRRIIVFLKPKEDLFITRLLIYANTGIFIFTQLMGFGSISKGRNLLDWGANFRPNIIDGEWWRLVTNIFLHGQLLHLTTNMVVLYFVGVLVEKRLGKAKYLTAYLLSGLCASIVSSWWHDATVSIGASGAIFGLYGTAVVCLLARIIPRDLAATFVISFVVLIALTTLAGARGGMDYASYIGGFVSGLIIGLILCPSLKGEVENVWSKQ